MTDVRLDTNWLDYAILFIYFVVVLGIGFAAKRYIKTSLDYFLSGRSLPAWITGLAFVSANLGATRDPRHGRQRRAVRHRDGHYYWIGAVPAMVFLGLVMMPFYYGSKVRTVPEYLRRRFDTAAHLFNSLDLRARHRPDRRREPLRAGARAAAAARLADPARHRRRGGIVLVYITLGGLSSAIYNEVLQFFVIVAALLPLTIVGLHDVGGWDGLNDKICETKLGEAALHALAGHRRRATSRTRSARPGSAIVFGLGFVLVVRLLDDELRRGPARALGQGPVRRPAHAADRRVPEAAASRSS